MLIVAVSSPLEATETLQFLQEITSPNLVSPVDVQSAGSDLFVLDDQSAKVLVFDEEGNMAQEFGHQGSKKGEMLNPQSIAVSSMEKVFVADTGNNRVQVFNKVGEFLFSFGEAGILKGQFKAPVAVALDQFGFVYVADRDNKRVQIFTPNGVFQDSIVTEGKPVDVAVDVQRAVYILQPDVGKISKYSSSGQKIQDLMCLYNDQNFVPKANNIAVDLRGDVYMAEGATKSIKKIDKKNKVLLSFGSDGNGRGQFSQPMGLSADKRDRVFVADKKNKRVEVFRVSNSSKSSLFPVKNSALVVDFDTTIDNQSTVMDICMTPGRGIFSVSDKNNRVIVKGKDDFAVGREGKGPGELKGPTSVVATLDGRIIVSDTGNNRVQVFDADGIFQYQFGQVGSKPGQFNNPQGLAVNPKGRIFVADTNNNRVQVFSNDGIYLKTIGARDNDAGKDAPSLQGPTAVAIDSQEQVYVLEPQTSHIKVFSEQGQYIATIGEKGNGPSQFVNPVDITFDENDNFYVADQGNYRVQVFNAKRKFLTAFGAVGSEPFTFRKLSAITAAEGRIYTADAAGDDIKVFRLFPDGVVKAERIFSTKTAYPVNDPQMNNAERYLAARDKARKEAVAVLVDSLNVSEISLSGWLRTDSVEILNDGQVKVTVSVPKDMSITKDKK